MRLLQFHHLFDSHPSSLTLVSKNRLLKISVPLLPQSPELVEVDRHHLAEDEPSVASHLPLPMEKTPTVREAQKMETTNDRGSKLLPHLLLKLDMVDRSLHPEVLLNLLLPSTELSPSCSTREEITSLFYQMLSFSSWVSYHPLPLSLVSLTRLVYSHAV